MQIEYQQTKKDYIDFYKAYYKSGLRKRLLVVVALLLIAISYFSSKPFDWPRFLIGTIASAVLIFSIYYFIPLLKSLFVLNKVLAKEPVAFEKKKLTTTDEGLLIESETLTKIWNWQSIISTNVVGDFIYFVLADKRMLLFPKKHFQSDNEATNFLGLVQNKIVPISRSLKSASRDKRKNPGISVSLFCFVPILGAIAGIILLADGASRYKEKWYILIGSGGIFFTVFTFLMLINPINHALARQWVPFAQMDVNTLMKDIEFYNIKHGTYPNNLEQLKEDDKMAPIYDAIISVQLPGHKEIKYNYLKIGDHYYLFSSGVDGIPCTKDDIYPQVAKADSAKFGLIHK